MYDSFTDIESDNSESEMELHVSWLMLVALNYLKIKILKKATGSVL